MATIKFSPDNSQPYAKAPVCVKVMPGVREQLMAIDDWQDKTRQFWAKLIEEVKASN